MTASVTELRSWKPDHLGDDPWVRATRLNRQAIASQTPTSSPAPQVVVEWRPVVGYEGRYEVSNTGLVRSLLYRRPRVMRAQLNQQGYPVVHLRRDGKKSTWEVHRIVVKAFLGPRPKGMVTRHLDGDKTNNSLTNLTYGTYSENSLDQVRHGTHPQARRTHCPSGHEYTAENTRTWGGHRKCRACDAARARAARRSRHLTPIIPLPTDDDDEGPGAA